ncbi:hypothetical protein AAG906_021357 [Vitis piasezkii]
MQTPPHNPQPDYLGLPLDSVTYTKLVQCSTRTGSLIHGKLAHMHMIKTCFKPCLFLLNNLLYMYCKCGETDVAKKLFDRMPKRNVVSWNSLISGYIQMGFYHEVMNLFKEARMSDLRLDKFTFSNALSVCGRTLDLRLGRLIHALITVSGLSGPVLLTNSLIDMYCKCGRIDWARLVFESADELDSVSWNSLIAGYVRIGSNDEMLRLLVKMLRHGLNLNSYALGSALKACGSNFSCSIECGKMLHGCAVKLGLDLDVVLMPDPNVVMYNAMIAGFLQMETMADEFANEAMYLFFEMQSRGMKPSEFTFSSILKACSTIEAFECGKQIHAQICKYNLQSDEFIGNALVELYSLSGLIEDGLKCFHSTPKLDIVSWTSLIVGHVQNGQFEGGLTLFHELLFSGRKPDEFTISIMLSACANLAAICMYAKCGDIDSANMTFKETKNPDVVSWSVMISSNAQHGCAKEAVDLFELMKGSGIAPNHITFLGVLVACSHGGLVEEGLRYFEIMKKDHGITPNVKHSACIVDLLGRAGRLAEAESFIMDSGFEAIQVHKATDTGKRVAERVIELEPEAAASYVLLYNIYNDAGIQMPATEIRNLMKHRGVKKEPGLSWIEVGNVVHSFVAGDRSHPNSQVIYVRLEEMLEKIKKLDYIDEKPVSDVSEPKHKDNSMVSYHSEKLAVTFGIISLPRSAPVRVMKNLRSCWHYHETMKLFSRLENREIILRDPIRFHRFRDGSCSCGDYW